METFVLPPLEKVWYLYMYLKKNSPDLITQQLILFKNDRKPQVLSFSDAAAEAFIDFEYEFDYIVRVLGSKELTATHRR